MSHRRAATVDDGPPGRHGLVLWPLVAWGLLILMTACSGGGKSAVELPTVPTVVTTPPAVTAPPPPATDESVPDVSDDRRAAQRILLRPADVPTVPPGPTSRYAEAYFECGRSQLLPTGNDPRYPPPTGYLGDETAEVGRAQTTVVNSWAVLAPNESTGREVVAILRRPEVLDCVTRRIADGFLEGPSGDAAQRTSPLPTPMLGDETVAFRTRVTDMVNFDVELTVIRRGRALAYLLTSRLGNTPFEDAERLRLARLMAERMR